uniref:Uncharacterized protein n=1 Tax=Arundo donax TaxID=35708 RepID=A0A0A8ZC50_ARUDO
MKGCNSNSRTKWMPCLQYWTVQFFLLYSWVTNVLYKDRINWSSVS